MACCSPRLISWWEPIAFYRRSIARGLWRMRWLLVRSVVYGLVGAALTHGAIIAWDLPVARPIWLIYVAAQVVPVSLTAKLSLKCLVPRLATIFAKHIAVQAGDRVRTILGEQILDYRICRLEREGIAAVLAICLAKRGKRRVWTIGLSPKVDVLKLDRAMRVLLRMTRRKHLR